MVLLGRRFTWLAHVLFAGVILSAAVSMADEQRAAGVAAILPGQDELLGDMLGLGATLPACTFAGAAAEHTLIRSRYACPAGEVILELRHPSAAPETALRTDRFAVVITSGSPPSSFMMALESRIRAREQAFEWSWTAGSEREESREPADQLGHAGALKIAALALATVLGWFLLRVVKRRALNLGTATSSGAGAWVASSVAALVLCASVHGVLRITGQAFSALVQRASDVSILTDATLILLLVATATLGMALLVRFATTARLRLWACTLVAAYLAIGWKLSLLPNDLHFFGSLSTLPPGTTLSESVAGGAPVTYRTNSFGLRKPDFELMKEEGVVRIALIGDSFMFGIGVDDDGTLPHHLATELDRRWPTSRFETLNLGIPGDNLSSHVEMFETAMERLDPNVVILGLTLANDLSRWDEQIARRDARRLCVFSFVRFLVGDAVESLWASMFLERTTTPAGLQHLDRELSRLEEIRNRSDKPHVLVFFGFSPWDPSIAQRLKEVPSAIIVPNRTTQPEEFIPGDGHPTSIGNMRSAAHIARTLANTRSWQSLVGEPPAAP